MKNCYYNGDLQSDIKLIKKKNSFDVKKFLFLTFLLAIAAVIGCGVVTLILGKITGATIGSFMGVMLINTFRNIKESKINTYYEEKELIDLYNEINDEYSTRISDELAKSRIKDCIIQTEKIKDVKRNSNNKVISKTEKIINYFYLLDPNDKIKVLKQISEVIKTNGEKEESIDLYLLDDSDIKKELLEIPVEKTLRLKNNKEKR